MFTPVKHLKNFASCKCSQLFTQSIIIFKFNTFLMTAVTLCPNYLTQTQHTDQPLNLENQSDNFRGFGAWIGCQRLKWHTKTIITTSKSTLWMSLHYKWLLPSYVGTTVFKSIILHKFLQQIWILTAHFHTSNRPEHWSSPAAERQQKGFWRAMSGFAVAPWTVSGTSGVLLVHPDYPQQLQ